MTTTIADPLHFAHGRSMPNRIMLAPLTNWQSNEDGSLGDDEFKWLSMRAQGGFGLTMTCATFVHPYGKAFPGQLGISSDDQLPGLTRLATALKANGGLAAVQLHHGGERRGDLKPGDDSVVAPYADAPLGSRAMTTGEVEQTIQAFIDAAARAEKAGFDGVEIHGAHSYLLCEFLNGEKNRRDDRYGGSFENRTRIFHEVIDGIRRVTGPDFQLGLRLSPERFGVTLDESQKLAQDVMTGGGLDYLDMSLWSCFKEPEGEPEGSAPLISRFAALDRGPCRLGVAGKIMTAAEAQKCVDHGADFVLIGKGAMLHHDFADRAMADRDFAAVPFPVPVEHFRQEGLGQRFIDYIAQTWPQYIAA
jgi:2,4-dienoyl-CoA reductase-like NADH-dependent reductase (Old Yellow Enzyme family)